ncbi:adenosylcobinamide-phosphate synthase [Desulfobaculum xiamenense]|uniref:Cobalamin biosynthesis protein CobD n=1 Tax=Desulfobaculum xiamenense TaxID=995050 RepID=A0A846QQI7_9BACT|nr:adenosylcobinamide-phosphate synthase CbiB [Desulfobaculum xiamenense]NJB69437.1 adenosylcobinamide-phosphate synthase [Desulfobaculum xiamenense]
MLSTVALPVVAVVLDAAFGDPHALPHPVRALGACAVRLEDWARRLGGGLKLKGVACMSLLAIGAWCVVAGVAVLPVVGIVASVYLAYAGLAMGQLLCEARHVAGLLDTGLLDEARGALSMLVSRETAHMTEAQVRAGLAETVSENLNDGFVAPFFYLVLGGPALLWAYKAVSTLDSMWGYKTERYRDFGWGAARMDDVLAWIPARLSAVCLVGAALLCGGDVRAALRDVREHAARSASPNAGWPMAAAALLCGRSMGGPAVYFGVEHHKPHLGPEGCEWDAASIAHLLKLVRVAGFLCVVGLVCLSALALV